MDYGKFKYERDVRQKEARKKQSRTGLKEIKFRPKIDRHDYATKTGHVQRFLKGGNKVKITIMFRGREMAHTDLGRKILDRVIEDFGESIVVESMPKQEGRNMIMVIAPNKRYLEAQAKAERAEEGISGEDGPGIEVPSDVIEAVESAEVVEVEPVLDEVETEAIVEAAAEDEG